MRRGTRNHPLICALVMASVFVTTQPVTAFPDPPPEVKAQLKYASLPFSDGFEDVSTPDDMVSSGNWNYAQIDPPGSASSMTVTTEIVHSGSQAVHFFTEASSAGTHLPWQAGTATKSDLQKYGVYAYQTEALEISAWFYFAGEPDLNSIFLFDFECFWSCANQSAGPRVALVDGYPIVEFGQIELPNITQDRYRVPTNRWFNLRWQMLVGMEPVGATSLYLDGIKIIDQTGTSTSWLPAVDKVKMGLTANSSTTEVHLYADDVTIRKIW